GGGRCGKGGGGGDGHAGDHGRNGTHRCGHQRRRHHRVAGAHTGHVGGGGLDQHHEGRQEAHLLAQAPIGQGDGRLDGTRLAHHHGGSGIENGRGDAQHGGGALGEDAAGVGRRDSTDENGEDAAHRAGHQHVLTEEQENHDHDQRNEQ